MKILGILIILIAAMVGYYKLAYPDYTYRYRMTVEIDTPDGLKSGSSVIEIHTTQWPDWLAGLSGGHTSASDYKGEAVAVDIAEGKTLFVLLCSEKDVDHAKYMLPYTFPMDWLPYTFPMDLANPWYQSKSREGIRYYGTLKNAKGVLPEDKLPLFVYFKDISDPKTVERVDPKNITASFGAGVKFKKIVIETTDDQMTWGIEKRLEWLEHINGGYLYGGFASQDNLGLKGTLHGGNFQMDLEKYRKNNK